MCNLGWKTACKRITKGLRDNPWKKYRWIVDLRLSPRYWKEKIRFEEKKTASTFHLDHHQRLPLWEPAEFFKQLKKSFCSPLRPRQIDVLVKRKIRKLHRDLLRGRPRLTTVNCAPSLIAFIWHSQNQHWVLDKPGLQNIGKKYCFPKPTIEPRRWFFSSSGIDRINIALLSA